MSKTVLTTLRYAKAIAGALAAGVAMYLKARGTDGVVDSDEWWQVIGATLAGGGLVGFIPNVDKKKA